VQVISARGDCGVEALADPALVYQRDEQAGEAGRGAQQSHRVPRERAGVAGRGHAREGREAQQEQHGRHAERRLAVGRRDPGGQLAGALRRQQGDAHQDEGRM